MIQNYMFLCLMTPAYLRCKSRREWSWCIPYSFLEKRSFTSKLISNKKGNTQKLVNLRKKWIALWSSLPCQPT